MGKRGRALDPNATHKVCTKCDELKPLSDYHNSKGSKDGKQSRCKDCAYKHSFDYPKKSYPENRRRWYAKTSEEAERGLKEYVLDPSGGKVCSACNEYKSYDEYGLCRVYRDGHQYKCKDCTAEYLSNWKKEHPDRNAEYVRRQRAKNR